MVDFTQSHLLMLTFYAFPLQVATSFSHTVLTDISMQRLELLAQVNKLYNNQSLQRFFDEMLKNIELMNWLKEITSGMWKKIFCLSMYIRMYVGRCLFF